MEKYQIVIAGNGEPAQVCTVSARHTYTDKSIAIIKTDKQNTIIEKIFTSVSGGFNQMLNIFYDDVAGKEHNVLHLNSGRKIEYEKLVLANGSRAIEPPIDGIQKDGVMLINKDPEQIRKMKKGALQQRA